MRGIEQAFESILDDLLLGISSAQLVLSDGTGVVNTPATANVQVVSIGQGIYIYAVAGINFVILILYAFEAFRTRVWSRLDSFDYTNLTSLVLAVSTGGKSIAEQAIFHGGNPSAKTRIQLEKTDNGVALTAANFGLKGESNNDVVGAENIPLVDRGASNLESFSNQIDIPQVFVVPRKPLESRRENVLS